jgi:hypothetical protein
MGRKTLKERQKQKNSYNFKLQNRFFKLNFYDLMDYLEGISQDAYYSYLKQAAHRLKLNYKSKVSDVLWAAIHQGWDMEIQDQWEDPETERFTLGQFLIYGLMVHIPYLFLEDRDYGEERSQM